MGETFYGLLGVDRDAEAAVVNRAYRELVKEHHPDVSGAPDASDTFKRLTTARDVLVDEAERARYDRLGHEDYVRRYLDGERWADPGSADDGGQGDPTRERRQRAESRTAASAAGTTSPGDYRARRRARRQARRAAWAGSDRWRASGREATAAEAARGRPDHRRSLLSVAPWLAIHLALFASAAVTAVVLLSTGAAMDASLPVAVLALLVVGLTFVSSSLHLVSKVYA